jgi:large subunit ribosomal protein L24
MSHTMKIRKGDLVHILAGKDRGKEGRVLEAHPRDRRVVVENLNVVRRHTKPRPVRNTSRVGGAQVEPGGVITKPAAVPVSNVMVVCPVCNRPTRVGIRLKQVKDKTIRTRVCKRADCGQDIDR